MTNRLLCVLALLGFSIATSGCAILGLGAAAGAGAIAADEINEGDEFDPLEKAYDDDPDTRPIIDDKDTADDDEDERDD